MIKFLKVFMKACNLRIQFELYRDAWRAAIHGVAKSRTRLSDWSDLMAVTGEDSWESLGQQGGQTNQS